MSAFFPIPIQAFPVTFGELTFYATSWKLSGGRHCAESGSVNGGGFVTNFSRRVKRLELAGRLFFRDKPSDVLLPLDTAVLEDTEFTITLHGIQCTTVSIVSYTVTESAESGVLDCRLELVIQGTISEAEETETEGTA